MVQEEDSTEGEREGLLTPRGPGLARRSSPRDDSSDVDLDGQRTPAKRRTLPLLHWTRRLVLTSSILIVLPLLALMLLGIPAGAPPWLQLLLASVAPSALSALTLSTCSDYSVSVPASSAYFPLFPVYRGRSLVLVVHATHDSMYPENLAYLIRKGVRCWQDADYVFIIQRDDALTFHPTDLSWQANLPPLPPNARYVLHVNECMDIGSVGWLLSLPPQHPDHVDTSRYRYFFFMNTSVRGPMLPVFLEDRMDMDGEVQCPVEASRSTLEEMRESRALFSWFDVFLGPLDSAVKMVGCTISCAFATHIQSYILAMDFLALQLLWQDKGLEADDIAEAHLRTRFLNHQMQKPGFNESLLLPPQPRPPMRLEQDFCRWQAQGGLLPLGNHSTVLACHVDFWDVVFNAEIGTSQAILKAGFNLAALEVYWRAVDFRRAPDVCARMAGITGPYNHYDDGIPADRNHPFDGRLYFNDPQHVVFTKYKNNKKHFTDDRLNALLTWEQLRNRTLLWHRTHNQTLHNHTVFLPMHSAD